MFQAILFQKLDESLFGKDEFEDILTSDVFGAFKYLPADYLHAWCQAPQPPSAPYT